MIRTCTTTGCRARPEADKLCRDHLIARDQLRAALKLKGRLCRHGDCLDAPHAKGLCKPHYEAARRDGKLAVRRCGVPGCDRAHSARGLCAMHYARASRGKLEVDPALVAA